jgi:hypothetical protein
MAVDAGCPCSDANQFHPAKAGIELDENGSIIPKAKGKPQ